MTKKRVRITATETIEYQGDYDLEELEEYLGRKLSEFEDLQAFVEAIQEKAHHYDPRSPGFAEHLERHGDVQGQEWVGEFTKEWV